jgi:hypothetical protein
MTVEELLVDVVSGQESRFQITPWEAARNFKAYRPMPRVFSIPPLSWGKV